MDAQTRQAIRYYHQKAGGRGGIRTGKQRCEHYIERGKRVGGLKGWPTEQLGVLGPKTQGSFLSSRETERETERERTERGEREMREMRERQRRGRERERERERERKDKTLGKVGEEGSCSHSFGFLFTSSLS